MVAVVQANQRPCSWKPSGAPGDADKVRGDPAQGAGDGPPPGASNPHGQAEGGAVKGDKSAPAQPANRVVAMTDAIEQQVADDTERERAGNARGTRAEQGAGQPVGGDHHDPTIGAPRAPVTESSPQDAALPTLAGMPDPAPSPSDPAPSPRWHSVALALVLAGACAVMILARLPDVRSRVMVAAVMLAGALLVVAGWALASGGRRPLAALAVIGALGASLLASGLIEHRDSAPLPAPSPAPASPERQAL